MNYRLRCKLFTMIFSKEAAVVKRGMLIEKPFTPKVHHDSELLLGLLDNGLPTLRGYVATSPKDTATIPLISHEDDPVLAHWRYGLGKSVAFTSDATSRWAADWVSWEDFNRFWAQSVRLAMREVQPTNFRVETGIREGKGHLWLAPDSSGRDAALRLPNFNDDYTGAAPDIGAHEANTPAMQFGADAYSPAARRREP